MVADLAFDLIAVALVISEKSFRKLSPQHQQKIIEVGFETDKTTVGKLLALDSEAVHTLNGSSTIFVMMSETALTEARAALSGIRASWIEAVAAQDPRAFAIADRF